MLNRHKIEAIFQFLSISCRRGIESSDVFYEITIVSKPFYKPTFTDDYKHNRLSTFFFIFLDTNFINPTARHIFDI